MLLHTGNTNTFGARGNFPQPPILDVVAPYVDLAEQDGGRYWLGLCPVHDDSRPSFSVMPLRGTWKCFTCQTGGDAISFLMWVEKITYPEAIARLVSNYSFDVIVGRLLAAPERPPLAPPVLRQRKTWAETRERLRALPWWRED